MVVAFYISGHGFGHASRELELITAIAAARPDARFVVRTSVPAWLLETSPVPLDVRPCETDTGVAQIDSLALDEEETARRAAAFYGDFDRRVEEDATFLRDVQADLVISDIPPLACAAAARAGVPAVALGNFTWDWIYAAYPAFIQLAPHAIPCMQAAYSATTLALRLPLHGGFEPMARVTANIPFIARRSTRDPEDTRRLLGVPAGKPVVLASFGGYGVSLPVDELSQSAHFTLIVANRHPPSGLLYEDLVAAADVVVSKPGYGIVSECVANGAALLYTSRGHFVEYDVFVAQMPSVVRCRYISQEDLLAGRWTDAIDALLAQPAAPMRAWTNGAQVAAERIRRLMA